MLLPNIVAGGETVGKSYKSSTSTIPVYPIMLSKLRGPSVKYFNGLLKAK